MWWDERRIGTQLAPTGRDSSIWEEWLPSRLELWHPDMTEWRRRSSAAGNVRAQRMQRLVASTQTSAPTSRDISDPLPRILSGKSHNDKLHKELWEMPADAVVTESTVEEFWTVLLPCWSDVCSASATRPPWSVRACLSAVYSFYRRMVGQCTRWFATRPRRASGRRVRMIGRRH